MCDDRLHLPVEADDPELDGCLLDAFSEDDGFCFAKLEAIEWRMKQRVRLSG